MFQLLDPLVELPRRYLGGFPAFEHFRAVGVVELRQGDEFRYTELAVFLQTFRAVCLVGCYVIVRGALFQPDGLFGVLREGRGAEKLIQPALVDLFQDAPDLDHFRDYRPGVLFQLRVQTERVPLVCCECYAVF